jgi:hypothetical protein
LVEDAGAPQETMASKPVALGEYSFASKKDAYDFYARILNETDLDRNLEGEEYDRVLALLLNHPRALEKIGSGLKGIKVSTGHNASNRCFHAIRSDDTIEDFSIKKCINGDHSDFHKFCIACRKAVEEEIRAYKREYFSQNGNSDGQVKCQATGKAISYDEAHADHREPFTFSAIVHFFVQAKQLDLSSVSYITAGQYGNSLADEELKESFKSWHKANAKLRVIDKRINLQKGYLGRVASTKADGAV